MKMEPVNEHDPITPATATDLVIIENAPGNRKSPTQNIMIIDIKEKKNTYITETHCDFMGN